MHDTRQDLMDRARVWFVTGVVGYALGVPEVDVRSRTRRGRTAAHARHVAMYLSYAALGMSLARVAAAFRRDRSTIAHACRIVEDRREDPDYDKWISQLEEVLHVAPPPALAGGGGGLLMVLVSNDETRARVLRLLRGGRCSLRRKSEAAAWGFTRWETSGDDRSCMSPAGRLSACARPVIYEEAHTLRNMF